MPGMVSNFMQSIPLWMRQAMAQGSGQKLTQTPTTFGEGGGMYIPDSAQGGLTGSLVPYDPTKIKENQQKTQNAAMANPLKLPGLSIGGSGNPNANLTYQPRQAPAQVPNMQAPPQVAPIDVNAILNQWKQISAPPLAREAEIPYIDDTQAAQAAYNRAKDTAGQQGRGAMDALMDVQGARGIVGSGLGVNEAGGVIGAVNQNLADVNRERMIQAYETELQRQTSNAANRITQRGQDISQQDQNNELLSALNALHGLKQQGALTQRSQDIDVGTANLNAGVNQRSQDVSMLNNALDNSTAMRSQDMNMLEALMKLYPNQVKPFTMV